jgi:hypothetical protein
MIVDAGKTTNFVGRELRRARQRLIRVVVKILSLDVDLEYIMTNLLSERSHMFNEDNLRVVILSLLKKKQIMFGDHEAKESFGREIVDGCKCPNNEMKENIAISLFPYFGSLYSKEEMPRLAEYGFF